MTPLDVLTPSLSFQYLRRMANIDDHWTISVIYDTLDELTTAALTVSSAAYTAVIRINTHYIFSSGAMAHALMHELYELLMYDLWLIFKRTQHDTESEYLFRAERDRIIEQQLDKMPFWTRHDVPIPGGQHVRYV